MGFVMSEKIQLGKTGWITGGLGNILAGAIMVDIYCCHECGKLEFFRHEKTWFDDTPPQKTCPNCGREHDFDYPKCPFCSYDYYGE